MVKVQPADHPVGRGIPANKLHDGVVTLDDHASHLHACKGMPLVVDILCTERAWVGDVLVDGVQAKAVLHRLLKF